MKKLSSFLVLSTAVLMTACNTSPSNGDQDSQDTTSFMEEAPAGAMGMEENSETADTAFVRQAGEGGLSEVTLAKLAKDKASDSKVKSFADQMMADHSKANEKLKAIAERKGLSVPSALPADKQRTADELNKKSGTDFDKAYIDQMVKDHETTVALFESAAESVTDAEMNGFIRETLPTLKQHLTHAQDLKK